MRSISFVLFFLVLITAACGKKTLLINAQKGSEFKENSRHVESSYRGLYIDSTSYILGDANKEIALLEWCQKQNITTLSFYDLQRVMRLGKAGELARFLKLAKIEYGIKENTAIVGSDVFLFAYLDTFNSSKQDTLARFNAVNLEREWWNDNGSFKSYIDNLSKISQWGSSQFPRVKTEEYVGWFRPPMGREEYIAGELVKNSDRILVHSYQTSPSFDYVQSRLENLGLAAKSQGKVFPVVIIFSAEPKFSAGYFKKQSFEDAYRVITDGYSQASFDGKNHIRLIGYQIFDQSYARSVKPARK